MIPEVGTQVDRFFFGSRAGGRGPLDPLLSGIRNLSPFSSELNLLKLSTKKKLKRLLKMKFLLLLALMAYKAEAMSSGAPVSACATMEPLGHKPSEDTGEAPFEVIAASADGGPNHKVQGKILI